MTSREASAAWVATARSCAPLPRGHIAVFGSTARDEATLHSDVDLLVEFEPGARVGLFAFVRLLDFLADVMDVPHRPRDAGRAAPGDA